MNTCFQGGKKRDSPPSLILCALLGWEVTSVKDDIRRDAIVLEHMQSAQGQIHVAKGRRRVSLESHTLHGSLSPSSNHCDSRHRRTAHGEILSASIGASVEPDVGVDAQRLASVVLHMCLSLSTLWSGLACTLSWHEERTHLDVLEERQEARDPHRQRPVSALGTVSSYVMSVRCYCFVFVGGGSHEGESSGAMKE